MGGATDCQQGTRGGVTGWSMRDVISRGVVMVSVFFLATAARGEWLLFVVYLGRDYLQQLVQQHGTPADDATSSNLSQSPGSPGASGAGESGVLAAMGLSDVHYYIVAATAVSFSLFWGIGFSFDRYFYKNRKHVAATWKCQPDRWLTAANERHEFILGSTNMLLGSIVSGIIACYIMNGGKCALYGTLDEYGWLYLLASTPGVFLYNEAISYYLHSTFHNPWLYRAVHKIHHRYGSPTLYSTTAMHPLEFLMYELVLAIPAFVVPLHPAVFVGNLLYGYYYGMMDHSGIKMDAVWPWQPSSMFHDDHHRHFHCNFGFNTVMFDRYHGTLRKKHHKYGEKVFGGGGKAATTGARSSQYMDYL